MDNRFYSGIAIIVVYACIIIAIILMGNCGFDTGLVSTIKETPIVGIQGEPGKDAVGCTVSQTVYGAILACPDGSTASLINGVDGLPGQAGQNALVEVIDLCGNSYRGGEVLLRLSDGHLYGVYASGQKIYLIQVYDGDFVSTDGFKCKFSVINGEVVYPIEEEQCLTN